MVDILISTDGSGPIKQKEEACLASLSTSLLPAVPQYPRTQMSRRLLKVANVFNAVVASSTKPVVALWAETAFMAAKLSEQIAIEQSFLSHKLSSLAQVNKA